LSVIFTPSMYHHPFAETNFAPNMSSFRVLFLRRTELAVNRFLVDEVVRKVEPVIRLILIT